MAIISMEFASGCLRRRVDAKVVVPKDVDPAGNPNYDRPMKMLVLLHGYWNRCTEWLFNSPIISLAEKYNICVVMPSGENSFYLDGAATGRQYAQFLGAELPNFMASMFGISTKKEDTFIGGLSMGGFGAIHTGLMFPERYGKLFGFSSALLQTGLDKLPKEGNSVANYEYYELMFGDISKLNESVNNPEVLVRKNISEGKEMPKIFMACGTEDFLLYTNRAFESFLTEQGVAHEYFESPGAHDFGFWNQYIEKAIRWMVEAD